MSQRGDGHHHPGRYLSSTRLPCRHTPLEDPHTFEAQAAECQRPLGTAHIIRTGAVQHQIAVPREGTIVTTHFIDRHPPGSGQPVILIGDHPTVGGYPRIATIISADLAAAGRLRIGSSVRFCHVTPEEARHAREARQRELRALTESVVEL